MPHFHRVKIDGFRIISSADLDCGAGFNILYGENGAGKTSVLEALFSLSTGRSFRTYKTNYLIQKDSTEFSVFGEVLCTEQESKRGDGDAQRAIRLGLRRARKGKLQIRRDGTEVRSASELAKQLPLIAVNPDSFQLLEGAPSFRRSTLDWLVFHVKPQFFEAYRDYRRCLKQRNILLRSGKIDYEELSHWDALLCRAAVVIDQARQAVSEELVGLLQEESGARFDDLNLSFHYKNGWGFQEEELSCASVDRYLAQLKTHFDRDCRAGHTSVGSHRFDLVIKANGLPASELLSRGQKKQLLVTYFVSLAKYFVRSQGRKPILLLDDLPSELDDKNLSELLRAVTDLGLQCFITAVDPNSLKKFLPDGQDRLAWFHVKHGSITKQSEVKQI